MAESGQGAHSIPHMALLFSSCPDSKKVVMGKGKEPPQRKVFGGISCHGEGPLKPILASGTRANSLGTELKGFVVLP